MGSLDSRDKYIAAVPRVGLLLISIEVSPTKRFLHALLAWFCTRLHPNNGKNSST